MDYKEKYEMALEGIQEILSSGEDSIKMSRLQLRLQGIFPELKESEDNKIRKRIIEHLEWCEKNQYLSTEEMNTWIAWLEKQCEQKLEKCMYSKDNYTDEDRKALCDGCEEKCKYDKSDDFTKALAECIHQAQGSVVDPMVFAEIWKDELIKLSKCEEPVSEDLEEAANKYAKDYLFTPKPQRAPNIHFINGANWQKQQMMAKAVDGFVIEDIEEGNGDFLLSAEYLSKDTGLKDRQKVKVIVIKDD